MLSKIFPKIGGQTITNEHVRRAEHTVIHPPTEQEFTVIVLDADDSFDVVIHAPNSEREIIWSLVKDAYETEEADDDD